MAKNRNTTPVADWRSIQDDREKYAAYLCSREWAVKREAVRKRSGGKCERCHVLPMDHVHHLTYERKYQEELEDLQASCKACHEFTHGKSDFDPARLSIETGDVLYLAGKISRDDWRGEFVANRSQWDLREGENWPPFWLNSWEYNGRKFTCNCVGPYFTNAGGHGLGHGPHTHGNAGVPETVHGTDRREIVFDACLNAIKRATTLLAWFDAPDQYGTIFEIGYAFAAGVNIIIGCSSSLGEVKNDIWLPMYASSDWVQEYTSPQAFVRQYLNDTAAATLRRMEACHG